jgi:ATP/maltotriose-dependent transcriptional regulator MalT
MWSSPRSWSAATTSSLRPGIDYAGRVELENHRHYMAAHLAHVHWARGRWEEAERTAEHALADGRGGITTRITAEHVLGYLAMGRGDWPRAEQLLGDALRQASAWPSSSGSRRRCGARLALGQADAAGRWLDELAAAVAARSIPGTLPAVDHGRGLLALATGDLAAARAALERAAASWRERGRFWEGTWALLDQGRCAVKARRLAEGAALTRSARALAEEVGARPIVAEVARLVAAGHTNREIAAKLFLSPKTVAAHVEHILTKLGAARRAEIAAWAAAVAADRPEA